MANGVAASAYAFDTHAFVKRLTGAGLSVEAAETLADEQSRLVGQVASNVASVASNAASKEELKEHKSVLKEYKSDLKEDFKRLEASFDTKLDARIEKSKFDLVKWLIGLLIAQSGLLFTVLRFFPKMG